MLTEEQNRLIHLTKYNLESILDKASFIEGLSRDIELIAIRTEHHIKKLEDPSYVLPWETPDEIEKKKQYESLGTLLGKTSC